MCWSTTDPTLVSGPGTGWVGTVGVKCLPLGTQSVDEEVLVRPVSMLRNRVDEGPRTVVVETQGSGLPVVGEVLRLLSVVTPAGVPSVEVAVLYEVFRVLRPPEATPVPGYLKPLPQALLDTCLLGD